LIVHISSINKLAKWAIDIPKYAIKLSEEFWPGPMTLILKRSEIAKDFITGGQENVGVRVPLHPVAIALLNEFEKLGGLGVVAPSANRFGAVSPTTASAVVDELGNYLNSVDRILDGGQSLVGIESTIIDCTNDSPAILRPGATTQEMIAFAIKLNVQGKNQSSAKTSGQFITHYSPKAKLVLSQQAKEGEGFLALAEFSTPRGAIRLASPLNVEEFAHELYYAIRLGDLKGLKKICVLPPTGGGLAAAIRDRLNKSAQDN
jgi:L-threonylcarbamoyladenylate synthase